MKIPLHYTLRPRGLTILSPREGCKKGHIFTKREDGLRHAIKHSKNVEKSAKELRGAKLRLLKALRDSFDGRGNSHWPSYVEEKQKIDRVEAEWLNYTLEEIIEAYSDRPNTTTQPPAESGRDGRISPATPPTPPGMRV